MFIDIDAVRKSLEWHSSPVDWCEINYAVVPFVAEFYNTFTNLPFVVIPPLLIYLYKDFAKRVSYGIQIVWISFIFLGLSSAYFHGTLSLFGQLLDELAILWIYALGVAMYCPHSYMPRIFNTRFKFSAVVITISIVATILSIWRPYVNAFAQMSLILPMTYFFVKELQKIRKKERDVYNLGYRSMGIMAFAIFLWFNDRIFCDFYTSIRMTYLHAIWHILSYIASSNSCTLGLYLCMKLDKPRIRCEIAYWPNNNMKIFGIPYVKLKDRNL